MKGPVCPTVEAMHLIAALLLAVSVAIGVYIYVLDRIFNTLVDQVI